MIRRRILLAAFAVAATAPVLRADCDVGVVEQAIAACDAAFPGSNFLILSARGYCYVINGGACVLI
ncbi:MAG: hypothetical protein HOQ09_07755 [Gemmatimonadaceae bacterium]|nr:hypothetical protein [Gemmatimonadaceae bacterium]